MVCVETGHCEVCDSFTQAPEHVCSFKGSPHVAVCPEPRAPRGRWFPVSSSHHHHLWVPQPRACDVPGWVGAGPLSRSPQVDRVLPSSEPQGPCWRCLAHRSWSDALVVGRSVARALSPAESRRRWGPGFCAASPAMGPTYRDS